MIKKKSSSVKRFAALFAVLLVLACTFVPIFASAAEVTVDYSVMPNWSQYNQADVSAFQVTDNANGNNVVYVDPDNGQVTVRTQLREGFNGGFNTGITMRELCPYINVGETYYLNFRANYGNYIYVAGYGSIANNSSFTVTEAMLNGKITLYGVDTTKYGLPNGYGYGDYYNNAYTVMMISPVRGQAFVPFSNTKAYVDALQSLADGAYGKGYDGGYADGMAQDNAEQYNFGYADGFADGVLQTSFIKREYLQLAAQFADANGALNNEWETIAVPDTLPEGYGFYVKDLPIASLSYPDPSYPLEFFHAANLRVNLLFHNRNIILDTQKLVVVNNYGSVNVTITYLEDNDPLQMPAEKTFIVSTESAENGTSEVDISSLYGYRVIGIRVTFYTDVRISPDRLLDDRCAFFFSAGSYEYGYSQGFDDGRDIGFDEGAEHYKGVFETTVIPSLKNEMEKEFEVTLNKATANAKQAGFNQGFKEGQTADSYLYTVITAPVDSIVTLFHGFLDFNILGVNMSAFVSSLITVCLVVAIIKFVI